MVFIADVSGNAFYIRGTNAYVRRPRILQKLRDMFDGKHGYMIITPGAFLLGERKDLDLERNNLDLERKNLDLVQ